MLLGLPRKSGKSHLAAMLALYLLVADGENAPQVIIAAASREQAKEVTYKQAKTLVETSPYLPDYVDVQERRLYCSNNRGILRAISAEGSTAHGLNPSAVIVDELHAFSTPKQIELWAALNTGSLARTEQMLISISTAGYDKATPLGRLYDRMLDSCEIERSDGLTIARNLNAGDLMIWYAAPDGSDIDDEDSWQLANPASWISADDLRQERQSAAINEADFRRLYLNQWTAAQGSWLSHGEWDACHNASMTFAPGEKIWVGLDLATKHDRTAVVIAGYAGDNRCKVQAFTFKADESATDMVVRAKLLLGDLASKYHIDQILYDPWGLDEYTTSEWRSEGLPMVGFPQTHARVCPATQALYRAVREQRLEHDGDPVLAAHVAAAVVVQTQTGWRLDKSKATRPVDAAIAMMMAVSGALAAPAAAPFYFEL